MRWHQKPKRLPHLTPTQRQLANESPLTVPTSRHTHKPSRLRQAKSTVVLLFLFTDPATPEIYTLSLHDALPILINGSRRQRIADGSGVTTSEVNLLLRQFKDMQRMMRSFGMMPGLRRAKKGKKGGRVTAPKAQIGRAHV